MLTVLGVRGAHGLLLFARRVEMQSRRQGARFVTLI